MSKRTLAAALVLASLVAPLTLPSPAFAAGSATDQAAAEVLFQEAKRMVVAGDVAGACPKFAESQRLDPSSGTLLNLGACYETLGRYASAWGVFTTAALNARASGDAGREGEANRRAKLIEPKLHKLTILVPPAVRDGVKGLQVKRDGEAIGEGQWGSALPIDPGEHTIEATAPGRKPWSAPAHVEAGPGATTVTIPLLEMAPAESEAGTSPGPTAPVHRSVVIEAIGGIAIMPSLGGDISGGPPALGGIATLHLAYELDSGAVFGVSGGYAVVSQHATGQPSTLLPVGKPADTGTTDDAITVGGFLVGVTGGWHLAGRFPALFRLGAGTLLGSLSDTRSGTFRASGGTTYSVGPIQDKEAARFVYLAPEARIGVAFAERFELAAGLQALVLFAVSRPTWDSSKAVVGPDGLAQWNAGSLIGKAEILLAPSLTLRAGF